MKFTKQEEDLLDQTIAQFGRDQQILKTLEEFSELQKAIIKFELPTNKGSLLDIKQELADVEIMLKQIKKIFGISEEILNEIKILKLRKLRTIVKK